MNDVDAIPWAGLAIGATTVAVILGGGLLLTLLAQFVVEVRNDFRHRYLSGSWKPRSVDLLGVPVWMVLEVTCLAAGLLVGLLMLWVMASLANDVRDWWHRGGRSHRRSRPSAR